MFRTSNEQVLSPSTTVAVSARSCLTACNSFGYDTDPGSFDSEHHSCWLKAARKVDSHHHPDPKRIFGLGVVRGVQLGPWPLWGRWVRWPVTPTGTGAGWLLCPSSVPAAAGRGLRPRVFSAHRPWPWPQLQVQDSVMGRRPIAGIAYIQTGHALLLQAIFTIWRAAQALGAQDCIA
jgi:hypothetical protein